jgi:hypothetical protein
MMAIQTVSLCRFPGMIRRGVAAAVLGRVFLGAVRECPAAGGDVFAGAGGGLAGAKKRPDAKQCEDCKSDWEIFTHGEDPYLSYPVWAVCRGRAFRSRGAIVR